MRLHDYLRAIQHLGPGWWALRVAYAVQARSGMIKRRLPRHAWDDRPLAGLLTDGQLADPESFLAKRRASSPRFFFDPRACSDAGPVLRDFDARFSDAAIASPAALAEEVAGGTVRLFGEQPYALGSPANWHRHPRTGDTFPHDRHWSELGDFQFADVRLMWEPARFGSIYPLVRAYWRTGDERYAEAFWQLVSTWREQNSPQSGVHWKCGQESAIRLMAWCFGLYGFMHSPATTPQRLADLAQMIGISAQRIAGNLPYALRQQNNHGISELTGLWTAGWLFPEFVEAQTWRQTAAEHLEREGRKLIYDDGGFCQYSAGYHRVMLQCFAWSLRLGELHGHVFSQELRSRVGLAGEFLHKISDASSGKVPTYGQNDGSWVLPLCTCRRDDFRPIVQLASVLSTGRTCVPPGPWDEDLFWLLGARELRRLRSAWPVIVDANVRVAGREAVSAPFFPTAESSGTAGGTEARFPATDGPDAPRELTGKGSGCHTLRSTRGFAFIRCGRFQHRPSQADLLHVDLWWRGLNVALDAGTYSYNAREPWCNPFAKTCYHNTVTVDGCDQMDRISRFQWSPWCGSDVRFRRSAPRRMLAYWEGRHGGYHRLSPPVSHVRGIVRLGEEHWLVLDSLQCRVARAYRLHWLLADLPHTYSGLERRVELQTQHGGYRVGVTPVVSDDAAQIDAGSVVRADPGSPRGWRAPCYFQREPALSFACEVTSKDVFFCTLLGPGESSVAVNGEHMQIAGPDWQAELQLTANTLPAVPLVQSIKWTGTTCDHLEIP